MSEVTVIANLPCLGLERGQSATVELTPMIQGALDGGKLSLAVSDHLTEILTGENPGTEVTGQTTISEHLADQLSDDQAVTVIQTLDALGVFDDEVSNTAPGSPDTRPKRRRPRG